MCPAVNAAGAVPTAPKGPLTSAVDAAGGFQNFPDNYATVVDLARSGELTLRIAYHLFPQTAGQELADLKRWTEMVKPGEAKRASAGGPAGHRSG